MTVDLRLDEGLLRQGFGAYPTGVTAVAATVTGVTAVTGVPVGLAASSFTSISLDPPMVSVSIANSSRTWPRLRTAQRLGVSVLGAHQESTARRLADRDNDRFAELRWHATPDGAIVVEGSSAWLDCSIEQEIAAGDHDLVLLRVHALGLDPAVPPLVFHASQYRRLEI
jgi:flavin reductase (DIM6/NTAB) family NADH-FMN oxidoreductase RutF